MIVTEPIGRADLTADLATFLSNEIYYPVLDRALCELDRRFAGANMDILLGIGSLTPGADKFLDESLISPFVQHYESNVADLMLELKQLKRMIERKTAANTMPPFEGNKLLQFRNFVSQYNDAFFEVSKLLDIACIIPITSVEAERSFSCLKIIKTHLRTTMLDDRLSRLAILSIHSGRAKKLDLDKVVDKFAFMYPHCRIQLTI